MLEIATCGSVSYMGNMELYNPALSFQGGNIGDFRVKIKVFSVTLTPVVYPTIQQWWIMFNTRAKQNDLIGGFV